MMHTCTKCRKEQSWSPFEDGICDRCYDKQFGIIKDDYQPRTPILRTILEALGAAILAALFLALLFAIMVIQPL